MPIERHPFKLSLNVKFIEQKLRKTCNLLYTLANKRATSVRTTCLIHAVLAARSMSFCTIILKFMGLEADKSLL